MSPAELSVVCFIKLIFMRTMNFIMHLRIDLRGTKYLLGFFQVYFLMFLFVWNIFNQTKTICIHRHSL